MGTGFREHARGIPREANLPMTNGDTAYSRNLGAYAYIYICIYIYIYLFSALAVRFTEVKSLGNYSSAARKRRLSGLRK